MMGLDFSVSDELGHTSNILRGYTKFHKSSLSNVLSNGVSWRSMVSSSTNGCGLRTCVVT